MRRRLRYAAGAVLVIFVVAAGWLVWKARDEADRLVTNPIETRRLPTQTPRDFGLAYDDVSLTTTDGLRLAGWYVPGDNGALIVAQHGYKSQRGEMLNEAEMLHRHGYSVLIPAMRAHDMSDGRLMTFGKYELPDLDAWVQFGRHHAGVDPERVGLLGNSLGGTLAIELAARSRDVKAVAANSPFSSMTDTLDTSVRFFTGLPPFPFAPLIRLWAEHEAGIRLTDVDAVRWIADVSPRPILLMQGGADVVISTTSGQRLYDAARQPKELWYDATVGHARFDTARPAEYERRVTGLFDSALHARP